MAATVTSQDKFEAAVKVIHSLPKNGSFQPSNGLLLKFYAYYKQATNGPCNVPRPAFWDVIGKAKWDAWDKLADLSKEEAMVHYVEELKKIIEAMPHTQMVQEFVEKLDSFYILVDEKPFSPKSRLANGSVAKEVETSHTNGGVRLENGDYRQEDDEMDVSAVVESALAGAHIPSSSSPLQEQLQLNGDYISNGRALLNGVHDETSPPNDNVDEKVGEQIDEEEEDSGAENEAEVGGDAEDEPGLSSDDSDDAEFCDTSDLLQDQVDGAADKSNSSTSSSSMSPSSADSVSSLVRPPSPRLIDSQGQTSSISMRGGGETSHTGGSTSAPVRRNSSNTSMGSQGKVSIPSGHRGNTRQTGGGSGGGSSNPLPPLGGQGTVNEQITLALIRLQQDMTSVTSRLQKLETELQNRNSKEEPRRPRASGPWWWPFPGIRLRTVAFLVLWPFFVHLILRALRRRRYRSLTS